MDRGNTVPTAVAFIAVVAIIAVCFLIVKLSVNSNNSIGKLSDMVVSINGKSYNAKVEKNKTAKMFLEQLPLTMEMQDYNENEKFGYLYTKFKTDSKTIRKIHAGDILLYGENTLVVAFKTFKSNDTCTLIGHIEDIDELSNGSINIIFNVAE